MAVSLVDVPDTRLLVTDNAVLDLTGAVAALDRLIYTAAASTATTPYVSACTMVNT